MEKEANAQSKMFDNIADSYDKINHILSFNIDKNWRKKIIAHLPQTRPIQILDVATGTGDLAIMMAKHSKQARITAIDISDNMMEIAIKKADKENVADKIVFKNNNVTNLPFDDNTFDYCTISFGARNFADLDKALGEIYRCLKPGGRLFIIEFSKKPSNKIVEILYKLYSKVWIPFIGGLISKNKGAYTYLPNSISKFIHWSVFVKKLKTVGFSSVHHKKLTFGIVIFYEGTKI